MCVVCMWFICDLYVICMWFVCYLIGHNLGTGDSYSNVRIVCKGYAEIEFYDATDYTCSGNASEIGLLAESDCSSNENTCSALEVTGNVYSNSFDSSCDGSIDNTLSFKWYIHQDFGHLYCYDKSNDANGGSFQYAFDNNIFGIIEYSDESCQIFDKDTHYHVGCNYMSEYGADVDVTIGGWYVIFFFCLFCVFFLTFVQGYCFFLFSIVCNCFCFLNLCFEFVVRYHPTDAPTPEPTLVPTNGM